VSLAELTGAEPDTAPDVTEPVGDGAGTVTPDGVTGAPTGEVRYCALVDCPGVVPVSDKGGRQAIYCEDHKGNNPERRRIRRQWIAEHGKAAGSGQDQPPRVAFEVGKSEGSKGAGEASAAELAAVEQRAKQLTKGLAILLLMGQPDDTRRADAADVLGGSDAFAAALRDLAVYEPMIRKLGAGGEVSERGMAWGAFGIALATIALPILMRHEVIKGGMATAVAALIEQPAPAAA
jgi:hypothetical protein